MSAGSLVTIACVECGHSAELELTEEQSQMDRTHLKFSCKRCKGEGRVLNYISMRERQQSLPVKCARCPELLSEERQRAMPGTRFASHVPPQTPKVRSANSSKIALAVAKHSNGTGEAGGASIWRARREDLPANRNPQFCWIT